MIAAILLAFVITAPTAPSRIGFTGDVRSMLSDVNAERRSSGAPTLALDGRLSALATERAQDMVEGGYFSHIAPDGHSPWDDMRTDGCAFRYAAENIAMAPDVRDASVALWESPEHRENTLGTNYRKIGIGVAVKSDGTKIFVEDFTD